MDGTLIAPVLQPPRGALRDRGTCATGFRRGWRLCLPSSSREEKDCVFSLLPGFDGWHAGRTVR